MTPAVNPPVIKLTNKGNALYFCTACDCNHMVTFSREPVWNWNGDAIKPTLQPSVRVRFGDGRVCHHNVSAGQFEYLPDCTHALAGQTIPMVASEQALRPDSK